MNKRYIKWEKFKNPLIAAGSNDEDGGRVMVRSTPFGVEGLQLNPKFPTEKVYVAHTNFDIDENIFNIVDNTEGVEICEIYSPYRMRVTIGKAFNSKRVRRLINEKLCSENKLYNFDDVSNMKIYEETLRLKSQDKPWSMFILPNGSFESKIFTSEESMENILVEWENVRKRIGGVILTY